MHDGLYWNAAGELEHRINGEVRATAKPENAADYAAAVGLALPERE